MIVRLADRCRLQGCIYTYVLFHIYTIVAKLFVPYRIQGVDYRTTNKGIGILSVDSSLYMISPPGRLYETYLLWWLHDTHFSSIGKVMFTLSPFVHLRANFR